MGYYTYFSYEGDELDQKQIGELEEIVGWNLEDVLSGAGGEDIKWYEHEKHLKEFSKMYPDKMLILRGVGEEQPDMWVLYVKNGKSKKIRPELIWPEFKIEMLE